MAKKKKKTSVKIYPDYRKAKNAARKLKVKSLAEYAKKYKKDRLLPAHPDRTYQTRGWKNWYDFLGKKKPSFYKTYTQAKKAAKRLKLNSSNKYKTKKFRKDPRLPSHPDEYYAKKGWKSWKKFLDS